MVGSVTEPASSQISLAALRHRKLHGGVDQCGIMLALSKGRGYKLAGGFHPGTIGATAAKCFPE